MKYQDFKNLLDEKLDEGMKQARKNVGASTCWDGYTAKGTKTKNGREVPNCVKEEEELEEEKKGLYANIHAKRKRGERPARPGEEDYPAKDAFKKSERTAKKEEVEYVEEKRDLPGNQEKIDANKNGKVDAHDFALLRARKGKKKVEEEKDVNVMPSTEDEFKKNKIKSKKEVKEGKEMTASEMKKREKIVKSMKKGYSGFKKRYGEKAKSVMYATATKMANK
jgi:hypothetical protein